MRRIYVLAAALAISACSDSRIEDAKQAVKGKLTDPESAQFQDVRVANEGVVCGQVNSKNLMGGYTGFETFAVAIKAPKDEGVFFGEIAKDTLCTDR